MGNVLLLGEVDVDADADDDDKDEVDVDVRMSPGEVGAMIDGYMEAQIKFLVWK